MPRRPKQSYRNPIRPGLLANGIIASVILAGVGMTYAWLGWQKKTRGDQNTAIRNSIELLKRQRQALQVRMDAKLVNQDLRQRVESMGLGLIDITDQDRGSSVERLKFVAGGSLEKFHLVPSEQ
ncbi:MAG TPA: hypothetical protein VG796_05785 [Verrucomicrobiales bacterium]|jgi:hypothetical protein|nr:hypothetical protein [Verrucomicrobiales bacterium]